MKNTSVLSLEFAGSSGNIGLLSRSIIEGSQKKIGVGCMKVNVLSKNDLTTPERAVEIVNEVSSKIGVENVAYIHPDCGLRRTKHDLAFLILENLVDALKAFKVKREKA
jgi:methionine synthase II (cobalamin-independent)